MIEGHVPQNMKETSKFKINIFRMTCPFSRVPNNDIFLNYVYRASIFLFWWERYQVFF